MVARVLVGRSESSSDWDLIKPLLPAGWEGAARAFGAIRARKGQMSDPEVLLRILLGHAAAGTGYRDTAAQARGSGVVEVSSPAVCKRLKKSGDWLEWIVDGLLSETMGALPDFPYRLRLIDATTFSKQGSDQADYRLHVSVTLPERRFEEAQLTDQRGGETFRRFTIRPGDVLVGDRCYGVASGIEHVVNDHGHVVVRINASCLPLTDANGERLDPLVAARGLKPGQMVEHWAYVQGADRRIVGRLCIYALTEEQAKKALARRRKKKGAKTKRPKARALESTKYVFIFTTLPKSLASTAEVFAIYRLRWQVELAFKTAKSVMKMGLIPTRLPETTRAWLLSKLLCALLTDRLLARSADAFPPGAPEADLTLDPTLGTLDLGSLLAKSAAQTRPTGPAPFAL